MKFFLQKAYADMRFGYAQIGFAIGLVNLLFITYNYSDAENLIPFWVYAITVIILLALGMIATGILFRKYQMRVDHDLGFEQQTHLIRALRLILLSAIGNREQTPEESKFIEYLLKIENNN